MAKGSQDYGEIIPANQSIDFAIDGDFVRIVSASSPLDLIVHGGRQSVKTGSKRRFDPFEKLRIENKTGSPISVTFSAGFGDADEAELVGTIAVNPGGTFTTAADVTVLPMSAPILVLAASSTRKSAILTAMSANSSILRVGDVNINSTRGIPLEAGQPVELETTAEIRAFNPGTAAKTISVASILT